MSRKRQSSAEENALVEKKRRLETRLRYLQAHLQECEMHEGTGRSPTTPQLPRASRTPTSTTRSNRIIQRPQKYDEEPHNVKLSGTLSRCRTLVQSLLSYKGSYWFAQPVDPGQVPGYHKIILNPMDLGTVREKLMQGMYSNEDEFCSDVRLIWSNAVTFNGKGSAIAKIATEMSSFFEEKFKKIQKPPPARQGSNKKKKKTKKQTPASDQHAELIKLRKEMENMRKTISIFSTKRTGSKSSSSKNMPVTREEKVALQESIMKLSNEQLERVAEIVSRRKPNLQQDDDELEIDFDTLDDATLRELQQHVRKTLASQRRRKTPKGSSGLKNSARSPAALSRHSSAPVTTQVNDSSSDSSSSSSESESESSDSEVPPSGPKQVKSRHSVAKKTPSSASYGDPSLFENIVPGTNDREDKAIGLQAPEDMKMNSDAWSNFEPAPEQVNQSNGSSKDNLWSDFKQKNQQLKQRRQEEERKAREAARARELELEKKQREEEEARRLAQEREREEEERLKREAKEADLKRERDLQARREEARRKREEALASADLDSQRAAIGGGFVTHGSMADLLG